MSRSNSLSEGPPRARLLPVLGVAVDALSSMAVYTLPELKRMQSNLSGINAMPHAPFPRKNVRNVAL
jgi:hypothetical protein